VYCGHTVGWIKVKLGTQVGLGLATLCIDGDQLSLHKDAQPPPIFGPYLLWPNGWMDLDVTWYGGTPREAKATLR